MVEASAVPRQIIRTEYITPKTEQEEKTSETAQLYYAVGFQGYPGDACNDSLLLRRRYMQEAN